MTLSNNVTCKELLVREFVSENLALRIWADEIFDAIDTMAEERVVINFLNVKSISRSFAHQYLKRKKESKKKIEEKNVPENILKMFKAVESSFKANDFPDMSFVRKIPSVFIF